MSIPGDPTAVEHNLVRSNGSVKKYLGKAVMPACVIAACLLVSGSFETLRLVSAKKSIVAEFSKTDFSKLEFNKELDFFVGEAGSTVMYFSKTGKHVLIGNILEVETGRDLSTERRRVLSDKVALEGRLTDGLEKKVTTAATKPPAPSGSTRAAPSIASKIEVDLPVENIAILNKGGEHVVHVVSDLNCSFCRKLHDELPTLGYDLEVREIVTGIFGGQSSSLKAAQVLCADDVEAATKSAYATRGSGKVQTCSDGEIKVAENTAWARKHNVTGTPVVIMSDGTVIRGANLPAISAWLAENT